MYDDVLDRANKFFENHTFEVYYLFDSEGEPIAPTNVKVKLTGVKEYISMGDYKPFIMYTAYILPSNEKSDKFNSVLSAHFGRETEIQTFDSGAYGNFAWVMTKKLSELLKYFSLPEAILTKVVNEVEPKKMNESLIVEGELDKLTRKLVQDVVQFFKHQRKGEFGLPEDLGKDEMVYTYPGFDGFSIFLDLQLSDDVETVDVDGELYYGDDLMYLTIISNPNAGYTILDELTKELNEVIRHELEHIKQHEQGYKFPNKEPKSPEKYYTQQHELEAQRAGFNKRAKSENADFETLVRTWFQKNPHKHTLNPKQQEKVIQQIIQK
jgi:hypothetical protein